MSNETLRQQLTLLLEQCNTYEDCAEFLRAAILVGKSIINLQQEVGQDVQLFHEVFENMENPGMCYHIYIEERQMDNISKVVH